MDQLVHSEDPQFLTAIQEIATNLFIDVSPIYERVLQAAQKENAGEGDTGDFLETIEELERSLDARLSEILPVLEKYRQTWPDNTGADLLHIWNGCSCAINGIVGCFREQVHEIIDENGQSSFVDGFPGPWNALVLELGRYLEMTKRITQ